MDKNTTQHAMKSVLEDMGRAAREGRARRFVQRPGKGVEVSMGELSLEPNKGIASPESGISEAEMDELELTLTPNK